MKNLKIKAKLIVAFGLVILLLAIGMIVSIVNLLSLSETTVYYAESALPVTDAMWTARRAMVSTERSLYRATATSDDALTDQHIQEAENELTALRDALTVLDKSYSGDMQDVVKFRALMDSTMDVKNQVYELLRAQRNEEGIRLMEEQYIPVFTEAGNLLVQMADGVNGRVNQFSTEAERQNMFTLIILIVLTIGSILIAVIVCVMIVRSLTIPIKEIEHAAVMLADGHIDVSLNYRSKDELGTLSQKMLVLTDTMKGIISDVTTLLNEMAAGNFNVQTSAEEKYVGDFAALLVAIRKINRNLSSTLSQINQASDQVSSGSEQVSSGAQALSQGTTEQASSIEELAATITEISEQIKTSATNAQHASEKATSTGNDVTESNHQMQEMIKAMDDISNSSSEISKIIKTIEDIAFQTNILALNAAVEAARAGAAGKGFAVVADEVRNLASKSAEASKNTASLIEGSLRAVENGTVIADKTARSLSGAMQDMKDVVEAIDGISKAANEQAMSVVQVTQGIDQISGVVQTNSATAEESAAASEELSGQAQMLKDLVGNFRLRDTDESVSLTQNAVRSSAEPNFELHAGAGKY